MPSVSVELRNIAGTEAALGWAGAHTVVVDRPEGRAGGRGLGFNGAQLLALTIGGCFCNDLRYVAHATGVELGAISVSATVELEGDPILATAATMVVSCETLDGSSAESIIEKARQCVWLSTRCEGASPWRYEPLLRVIFPRSRPRSGTVGLFPITDVPATRPARRKSARSGLMQRSNFRTRVAGLQCAPDHNAGTRRAPEETR